MEKLTETTMYTQLGVLIGTPEYMSPEQADLTGLVTPLHGVQAGA